jgi:hypothetical protein
MKTRNMMIWMGTLPLMLGGFARAAEVSDSEQVNKLLAEAKAQAIQVRDDATAMEAFTRVPVSRELQGTKINELRDHFNALGRTEASLKDAEAIAAPWQRQVIDRIVPFLDELNGYTNAVIEHLNGTAPHTVAEYKDYLEANADYATDLAKMIGGYVDYGRTKVRFERLSNKLEVATR